LVINIRKKGDPKKKGDHACDKEVVKPVLAAI